MAVPAAAAAVQQSTVARLSLAGPTATPLPCSLHGKNFNSENTQNLLADLTASATKGQRRLYVSGGGQVVVVVVVCMGQRCKGRVTGSGQAWRCPRSMGSSAAHAAPSPPCPDIPQVSSTEGIQKGHWVRLYAKSPLRSAKSAAAVVNGEARPRVNATALGGVRDTRDWSVPVPGEPASTAPGADGFLPLPEAFIEGRRQADELGLGGAEVGAAPSVSAAVADGTLDAYLYGNNAADSGPREWSGAMVA